MDIPPVINYFSQNREDLYLLGLLHREDKGFYIDVGCFQETLHSVTKLFYNLGWSGINIDANIKFKDEYLENRPRDKFLNCGVSNKPGEFTFRDYYFHDGLSTFSSGIQTIHQSENLPYKDYLVECKTLEQIFEENNVLDITFLKVDVEGLELQVLKGNNWNKYRPKVVLFEASDERACSEYLSKQNYRKEFYDGLNVYFVNNDFPDITINDYCNVVLMRGVMGYNEQQLKTKYDELQKQLNKSN